MKIVKKFQQGGQMAPAEVVPTPAQAGDPMEALIMAAQEALSTQNPELAMQVCAMLLELVGGAQAVGQSNQNQPIFKKGGRLVRYTSPLDKFRK